MEILRGAEIFKNEECLTKLVFDALNEIYIVGYCYLRFFNHRPMAAIFESDTPSFPPLVLILFFRTEDRFNLSRGIEQLLIFLERGFPLTRSERLSYP